MPSQIHRRKGGAWAPADSSDIQVYYDGTWHNPCEGPKTVWHFKDGTWTKFPCGVVLDNIFFGAYPDTNSFNQQIWQMATDNTIINADGDMAQPLTNSTYTENESRDFQAGPLLSWDYKTVYSYRIFGGTNTGNDNYLYFTGSGNVATVEFDLTIAGSLPGLTLPIWIEIEFAFDPGSLSAFWSDQAGGDIPFVQVTFDDRSRDEVGITDIGATGTYNGWNRTFDSSVNVVGDLDETQWHILKWKVTDEAGLNELTIDGDTVTLPAYFAGGGGEKVTFIDFGLLNAPNNGWLMTGRVKVGTSDGASDIIDYNPGLDGFPWQDQTTPIPNYADYPDRRFPGKPYVINFNNPGDVDFSFPNFTNNQSPSMIAYGIATSGDAAVEVWKLRTDGVDSASSDTPSFPSDRIFQLVFPGADIAPAHYLANWGVTPFHFCVCADGLHNLIQKVEVDDGSGHKPISLYKYDFATSTFTLIKDGTTWTSGDLLTGELLFDLKYNPVNFLAYSPSGNKIAFLKQMGGGVSGMGAWTCNADGSGLTRSIIPYFINVGYIAWNPLDESKFYVVGNFDSFRGGSSSNYSIIECYTDGVTPAILLYTDTAGISIGPPRFSPDGSVMAFGKGGTANDFYTLTPSGTLTTYPTGATITASAIAFNVNTFGWSRDGAYIAISDNGSPGHVAKYELATDTLTELVNNHFLAMHYPGQFKWFHGWQGE